MKNARIISCIIGFYLMVLCPLAARAVIFTLSDDALMSLDYNYLDCGDSSATITSVTNVAGPGVKFDILYSDPTGSSGKYPYLQFASCIYGGKGSLTGIDISSFDAFALKFTILSANGVKSPSAGGPLVVGALINLSNAVYAYRPEVIAFNDPYNPTSATSVTTTDADQISLIGFTCNIPYWWYSPSGPLGPSPWDPTGATISLLVEPAPGAMVITPEPATLLLLGFGAVLLRKKRS
jgi:hypothetical protein